MMMMMMMMMMGSQIMRNNDEGIMMKQSNYSCFNRDVAQTKEKAINETKQTMIQVQIQVDFKILLIIY